MSPDRAGPDLEFRKQDVARYIRRRCGQRIEAVEARIENKQIARVVSHLHRLVHCGHRFGRVSSAIRQNSRHCFAGYASGVRMQPINCIERVDIRGLVAV
jgi:hypothetical protein